MRELPPFKLRSAEPSSAVKAVVAGSLFVLACVVAALSFSATWAAAIMGFFVAAALSFIVLVAMPRSVQLSIFGAAIGISADGAYAKLTDQTPVTVANALISLATSMIKAVSDVGASMGAEAIAVAPIAVWSFMIFTIAIMGASFLIDHKD
jgi:hypothetical protein